MIFATMFLIVESNGFTHLPSCISMIVILFVTIYLDSFVLSGAYVFHFIVSYLVLNFYMVKV